MIFFITNIRKAYFLNLCQFSKYMKIAFKNQAFKRKTTIFNSVYYYIDSNLFSNQVKFQFTLLLYFLVTPDILPNFSTKKSAKLRNLRKKYVCDTISAPIKNPYSLRSHKVN
jgi:hypothetical protein